MAKATWIRLLERSEWVEGCLRWTGAADSSGYGQISVNGRAVMVHRVGYELQVGPIPPGMTIDHGCHNADPSCPGGRICPHRRCFLGEHLAPKSMGANTRSSPRTMAAKHAARTHCPQGHPYDETNTLVHRGRRNCLICKRASSRRSYARRKGRQ
jgi:hypothetical protein